MIMKSKPVLAVLGALALATSLTAASANAQSTVPCSGSSGARFNLEPRNNAVPQNQPNADFLLNRVSPGDDLIVQGANDWRGNLKTPHWDGAVSGYYVHRSNAADCSVQFEGGLPNITFNGGVYNGIGNTVVAADPARDVFFLADARIGPTGLQDGIGLFRATAANLLNTAACPNGTHTAAQAATCWAATPPALVLPAAALGDVPALAVDERSTGSGKGAGDVYVLGVGTDSNSMPALLLSACTNTLNCGAAISLPNSSADPGFAYAQVRSNGVLTIAFPNSNTDGSVDVFFVTCTPAGAPKPPVCGTPKSAQHIAIPINSSLSVLTPVQNFGLLTFTFPKLTNRAEAGGKFTTFLVYDQCKNPFSFQNPPVITCVDAEVLLTSTVNDGATWSKPVPADTATGHHFFPSITTDASTGIVHLAYYSTEGDPFNHSVRVFRNQIRAGTTAPGTPIAVTTVLDPIDETPAREGMLQNDFFLGIVARGTSASGQSHLYTSFDSTVVPGSYRGQPLTELNNHISLVTY
jgi:hypothetical protein